MINLIILNAVSKDNDWPLFIVSKVSRNDTVQKLNNLIGTMRIGLITINGFKPELLQSHLLISSIVSRSIYSSLVFLQVNVPIPIKNFNISLSQPKNFNTSWSNISTLPINLEFHISDLICGRLTTDYSTWLSNRDNCSPVSGKIANSMIRVAATRIFADPAQSVLELPVNSIDSYRQINSSNMPSVGKFGMGFFSILYWLLKFPTMGVCIDSKPRDGIPWTLLIYNRGGNLVGYFVSHVFTNRWSRSEDGDLERRLSYYQSTKHGTSIYLVEAADKPVFTSKKSNKGLSPDLVIQQSTCVIDQMISHIKKLEYISDVNIYTYNRPSYNYDAYDLKLINVLGADDPESKPIGSVLIKYIWDNDVMTGFKFQDWAGGITLETLFTSLLIPSISTKTLDTSYKLRTMSSGTERLTIDDEDIVLKFQISVGSVLVVNIIHNTDKFTDPEPIYHLDLPIWAKVPVSRDDIVVEENSLEYIWLLNGFKSMVDVCLDRNHQLQDLLHLMDLYASYSNQPTINRIIQQVYDFIDSKTNVIYIPNRLIVKLLQSLLGNSTKIAHLNKSSISRSTKQLLTIFEANNNVKIDLSFNDILIVVLSNYTGSPTNGGLTSFVFISHIFYTQTNWVENLISSYSQTTLTLRQPSSSNKWSRSLTAYRTFVVTNGSKTIEVDMHTTWYSFLKNISDQFYDTIYSSVQAIITKSMRYNGTSFQTTRWSSVMNAFFQVYSLVQYRNLPYEIFQEYVAQVSNAFTNIRSIHGEGSTHSLWIEDESYEVNPSYYETLSILMIDGHIQYQQLLSRLTVEVVTNIINWRTDVLTDQLGENYILLKSITYDVHDDRYDLFLTIWILYISLMQLDIGDDNDLDLSVKVGNYILSQPISSIEAYAAISLITKFLLSGKLSGKKNMLMNTNLLFYIVVEIKANYSYTFFHHWKTYQISSYNRSEYDQQYYTVFYEPMMRRLDLYLNQLNKNIPSCIKYTSVATTYKFTANKLISYVFQSKVDNITDRTSLQTLLFEVTNHSINSEVKFQSVSVAVNEGTSKSFVSSVLTELLQNSIDAIRSNITRVQQRIDINLCQDDDTLQLSFTDYVGIPDSSILSLLIPFLSGKSTDDMMATGEMGTGFFNVYRQPYCSQVIIRTNDLHITAKPILNDGQVYDIEYNVGFAVKQLGTEITIFFTPMSNEKIIDLLVDIQTTAHTLAVICPFPTYVQSQLQSITKHLVYEDEVLTVYVTEQSVVSYVLTNGVPFGLLMPFAENSIDGFANSDNYPLSMNVILNLKKGQYIPTQSRHRMQGITGQISSIITGLWYALTYKLIRPEWKSILKIYLSQSDAKSSISSLKNYNGSSIKSFISSHGGDNCTPCGKEMFYGQHKLINVHNQLNDEMIDVNISFLIRETIKLLGSNFVTSDNITNVFNKILDVRQVNKDKINYDLIHSLLQVFFKHKTNDKQPDRTDTININTQKVDVHDIERILSRFVQVYYTIGQRLSIPNITFPAQIPTILIKDMEDDTLGYYINATHSIHINQDIIVSSIQSLRSSWKHLTSLYNDNKISLMVQTIYTSPWSDIIGNIFPMSTVVHELQHSIWRNNHQATGVHEPMLIDGQRRTYDEVCQFVYEKILAAGFWSQMMGKASSSSQIAASSN